MTTLPHSRTPTLEKPLPGVSLSGTIPRQHGAWSVLLLSFALGAAVAGHFTAGTLLLLLALAAAMPARHVIGLWLRAPADDPRRRVWLAWATLYALVVALSVVPLSFAYDLRLLLPLGAVAGLTGVAVTALERSRRDRTLGGELLGMIGLCVALPLAYVVSEGSSWVTAAGLWLLALLMFCGGVFHVRHLCRAGRGGPANGPPDASPGRAMSGSARASLLYHLGAMALVLGLGAAGLMPSAAFLALAPAAARAAWSALQPPPTRPNVRRLGFSELAHGVLFTLLAVAVFRLQS